MEPDVEAGAGDHGEGRHGGEHHVGERLNESGDACFGARSSVGRVAGVDWSDQAGDHPILSKAIVVNALNLHASAGVYELVIY